MESKSAKTKELQEKNAALNAAGVKLKEKNEALEKAVKNKAGMQKTLNKTAEKKEKATEKIKELVKKLSEMENTTGALRSLSVEYKNKFKNAKQQVATLTKAFQAFEGVKDEELKQIENLEKQVDNLIRERNAEKAKANTARKQKNVNNRITRQARQDLYNRIKKLNKNVQESFKNRIPKANTPQKIQEIRNQISQALQSKQNVNRKVAAATKIQAGFRGMRNRKNLLQKEKKRLEEKIHEKIGHHGGQFQKGRIGKWKNAVNNATSLNNIKQVEAIFNKKFALHTQIVNAQKEHGNKKELARLRKTVMQRFSKYNKYKEDFNKAMKPIYSTSSSENSNSGGGIYSNTSDTGSKKKMTGNPMADPQWKPENPLSRQEKRQEQRQENKAQRLQAIKIKREETAKKREAMAKEKAARDKAAQAKAAQEKIERAEQEAKKKEAREKANAEKRAAREKAKANEAQKKEAQEKEARAKANANAAAKAIQKRKKNMRKNITKNKRLNQGTKNQLLKRLNNGNNLNKVSEARENAVTKRTAAAVKIQAAERGRQAREKLARKKANNALKVSINTARGVIERSYSKLNNNNKKGFMTQLNKAKNRANVKRIQESAKMKHMKAVAENKEKQRKDEKKRKENDARAREAEQRRKQQLARQEKARREAVEKARRNEGRKAANAKRKQVANAKAKQNRALRRIQNTPGFKGQPTKTRRRG